MKRVLITGAHSYIGNSIKAALDQWPQEYRTDTVSMSDGAWKSLSFAGYDSVFHVAGIAHSDMRNVTEARKAQYYQVNTELTLQTAAKAKAAGVKQFIFMSSGIVYGDSTPVGVVDVITRDTVPAPANFYGDSKLQAEKRLFAMEDEGFKVCVLRPPMIYGKGAKGNYPRLARLAQKCPLFPDVYNVRSMLYIGNLAAFVRLMIDNRERGLFWPQNAEYSCTSHMARDIARVHGKRMILVKGFEPLLRLVSRFLPTVNKAFGSLAYDQSMSEYRQDYRVFSYQQSIEQTENGEP